MNITGKRCMQLKTYVYDIKDTRFIFVNKSRI
nr:MAG TPA: hypothetical protein [Bacteriophage sp.]